MWRTWMFPKKGIKSVEETRASPLQRRAVCCLMPPIDSWQPAVICSRMNQLTCIKNLLNVACCCCLKAPNMHRVYLHVLKMCTYRIWSAEILSLSTSWALLKSDSMFCVSLLWTALSSVSSRSCLFSSSCSWALRNEKSRRPVNSERTRFTY